MKNLRWFSNNRKLIEKNETKISFLQIFGFIIMIVGILSLMISSFYNVSFIPSVVSIYFFVTMLGLAFAFPSLLSDPNKGLSTMRIVVFMVTNVICMLLLKIGWADGIKDLKAIGLDQYWMGVIAFVFGAKATQSFFESKMAVPAQVERVGMASVDYTNADIAKLAVAQNEQYLKTKFPNILCVSDAVHDLNSTNSYVIALYLKDNNTVGIPDRLEVKMPDGTTKTIATEIVKGLGKPSLHCSFGNKIKTINQNAFGSVCCFVKSNDSSDVYGVVTAGHVYTSGNWQNLGGDLSDNEQLSISINSNPAGQWIFQILSEGIDIAIAKLKDKNLITSPISFSQSGYQIVSDNDVKNCSITTACCMSGSKSGYILDHGLRFPIPYDDGSSHYMCDIILIGSTNNRQDSKTLTKEGDSGGCVYNSNTKQLIGLILGGDDNFTYVLPIKETLENQNYSLL